MTLTFTGIVSVGGGWTQRDGWGNIAVCTGEGPEGTVRFVAEPKEAQVLQEAMENGEPCECEVEDWQVLRGFWKVLR